MYLGVDGGGTKTAFVLLSGDGRLCARVESGPCYHPVIGIEGVQALLADGIDAVLRQAGVDSTAINHAFFGLPAYGEDTTRDPALARTPSVRLREAQFHVDNDMVCGWAGALLGGDGISVTAGTGSIAYGEYGHRRARAGGWGEVFGDEGSAYWLGREGLALFSRMADGREPPGPLLALSREHFKLGADLDLAGHVNAAGAAGRSAIAALSRLVTRAAAVGDPGAVQLCRRAALELAALAKATYTALAVPDGIEIPVTYSGGVFNAGALILEPFRAALATEGRFRLQVPSLPPDLGAALYAARLVGMRFTDPQLQSLVALSHSAGPAQAPLR